MRPQSPLIGYCTNVHAGFDLQSALVNLDTYSVDVLRRLCHARPSHSRLGIGWWLSEPAAREVIEGNRWNEIKEWLASRNLDVFTLNGFPQGNFHEKVVKHRVYQPTWWDQARLDYTRNLVKVLTNLIPEGATGSISTLPIAWGIDLSTGRGPSDSQVQAAVEQLQLLAMELEENWKSTGREIVLAIEPEPGCLLGESSALRIWMTKHFLRGAHAERHRRFLTVCHDICHGSVMREDQCRELQSYRDVGMRIGKVQVSSAISVDWDCMDLHQQTNAIQQLGRFAEDRYLHQTTVRTGPVGSVELVEDLPWLMHNISPNSLLSGNWRIHFHVPIHLSKLGLIDSTQQDIGRCMRYLLAVEDQDDFFTGHWEIETYAWGVLPEGLAVGSLAEGIFQELNWFYNRLNDESVSHHL